MLIFYVNLDSRPDRRAFMVHAGSKLLNGPVQAYNDPLYRKGSSQF